MPLERLKGVLLGKIKKRRRDLVGDRVVTILAGVAPPPLDSFCQIRLLMAMIGAKYLYTSFHFLPPLLLNLRDDRCFR
jgi:hypothetical protein